MLVETWIAAIIVVLVCTIGVILGFSNMRLEEKLERALKVNEAQRNEIRRLKVELMMQTTTNFTKKEKNK
jgi:uncharacterized membrane-anchored protein YhcB (DUF1043 family)